MKKLSNELLEMQGKVCFYSLFYVEDDEVRKEDILTFLKEHKINIDNLKVKLYGTNNYGVYIEISYKSTKENKDILKIEELLPELYNDVRLF